MDEEDKAVGATATEAESIAALVAMGVRPPAIAELVVKAVIAGRIPGLSIHAPNKEPA